MISIPYLVFTYAYIFLFLGECINIRINSRYRILIMGMSLFTFFICLRGCIFVDWVIYRQVYIQTPKLSDFDIQRLEGGFELGYSFFSSLIKTFTDNYFVFQFLNSVIDLLLLTIFIRYYFDNRYYLLAFVFYFITTGFLIEFNLFRNAKSILLFMVSLRYIESKKCVKYYALNLLGLLFHSSALIFFPLYFILGRNFKKNTINILVLIGFLFFIFHIPFSKILLKFCLLPLKGLRLYYIANFYLDSSVFNTVRLMSFGTLEKIFTFIFLQHYKTKINNKKVNIIYNIFYIYIICFFYCSDFQIIFDRVGTLFSLFYVILYPEIYRVITKKKKQVFLVILFLYCFIKIISLFNSPLIATYNSALLINEDKVLTYKDNVREYAFGQGLK